MPVSYREVNGDLWVTIFAHVADMLDGHPKEVHADLFSICWIPAHTTKAAVEKGLLTPVQQTMNQVADATAKEGLKLHSMPAEEAQALVEQGTHLLQRVQDEVWQCEACGKVADGERKL